MPTLTATLKNAVKNKVLQYIFSRYATYLIQFINSLFIAVYLGPYYLGIWGFITLIIQYLNQINLGIAHSANAIISIHKNREWYVKKIIGTSISMLIGLSFIIILIFLINILLNINIGAKYNFSAYAPAVVLIGILAYFNTLFSNVFRVYGKVTEIAVNQSAFPVLMLIAILLFRGENLLWALVCANLLAFLFSFSLYLIKQPITLKPILDRRLVKSVQKKGWHLFIYNTSFYLIIISTRSFVSAYFSVEEFGYFTFAFSLANVVLLLLQSFSFLIYPKLINKLASASIEKAVELLYLVRDAYLTSSHLLVHLAILAYPIFLIFFPQYHESSQAFKLIALTVVLYTNSFGYSGLLIAKGFEKKLGKISLLSLIINIVISFILISIIRVPFQLVILATMITYLFYVLMLGYIGRKTLGINTSLKLILKDIFPFKLLCAYILSLVLIFFSAPNSYFISPLLLFLIANLHSLIKVKKIISDIINNSELVNI